MYEPDKNGYFVCKENLLITNTALCLESYRNNNKVNELRYNENCAKCKTNLKRISGRSLEDFSILEKELDDHINSISIKSAPSEVISW